MFQFLSIIRIKPILPSIPIIRQNRKIITSRKTAHIYNILTAYPLL